MNLMPEILEKLGVEVGEEFNLYYTCDDKLVPCSPVRFSPDFELIDANCKITYTYTFSQLMKGAMYLRKLPFKPKKGDIYHSVYEDDGELKVDSCVWMDIPSDYVWYNAGLVFRTEEEARKIGIPKVKQMIKEYKND